ncbi:MAG TPA: STAS domain-containing protein [Phycisphaerae bacterium]|nr:STAS domain-containing protein [Phycisphaerae bacterium]
MAHEQQERLRLELRETESATVIRISGSAGMDEAETIRIQLEELTAKHVPVIVLDLSDMDFISSLGLGAIIAGHLKTRHYQGEIRLANPQPAVRKLLETTRLTKLFPLYASVDGAASA